MTLIVRGEAFQLTSVNGDRVTKIEIPELRSDQEESDTRVVLYAVYAAKNGYKSVKIRSPDSDIFFVLLHHASKINNDILFDTGKGNTRKIINISKLSQEYGDRQCSALLALHAYTGCDTTSAFKGIGKVKPIKVLRKKERFEEVFSTLGDSWEVQESTLKELESFTCTLYGFPRFNSLNDLRLHLLKKKCVENNVIDPNKTVDLASLPPCYDTLTEHVKRTNFQVIHKIGMVKCLNFTFSILGKGVEGSCRKLP